MSIPTSPNTDLYTLGKGILSIGEWAGTVAPAVLTDVGNCPDMSVEVTEESLPHYSSRADLRKKDKEVTLQIDYTVSFTLDEMSILNIKMFLRGTSDGNTVSAAKALTHEYAMKFISDNPVGINQTWEFWKVKIKPNGAFSLIGDEYATLAFTAEGLADTDNHPLSDYFDVTSHYAASTTST